MNPTRRSACLVMWVVVFALVASLFAVGGHGLAAAPTEQRALVYPSDDLPLERLQERFQFAVVEDYQSFALVEAAPPQLEGLRRVGASVQELNTASMIHAGSFDFDTADGEPYLPAQWRSAPEPGSESYHIIQFIGPIKNSWTHTLENHGLKLYGYMPRFAAIVKGTPEAVQSCAANSFVRWHGPYHPAYRVQENNLFELTTLLDPAAYEKTNYLVELFAGEKVDSLLAVAERLGLDTGPVTRLSGTKGRIRVEVTASPLVLSALARVHGVAYIQPDVQLQLFNDKSRAVTNTSTAHEHGLKGENQVVAVTDTGLDYGHELFADEGLNQPGANHRKVNEFIDLSGFSFRRDKIGHGTHVAGTIAGDSKPYGTANDYDGHAVAAKLLGVKVFNDFGLFGAGTDLYRVFLKAHEAGAHINSNSWGGDTGGDYDLLTADTDRFAHDYPGHLMVFANGNFGTDGEGTVGSPGGAKNVLSVGAVQTDAPENIPEWSSRGPTRDGRIKPDVLAPGEYVTSAKTGTTDEYIEHRGTSMATPNVSGVATLVRQYFTDGYYPSGKAKASDGFAPSAALIKAVLINGAQEVSGTLADASNSGSYPNNSQGWGRVDIEQSLHFEGDSRKLTVWDSPASLATGDKWTAEFQVTDSETELRVHAVWNDAPAESGADQALVNDLHLRVTAPDGTTFVGNQLEASNPGYSVAGSEFDTINNVEGVRLVPGHSVEKALPTGTYTVEVIGANVASGPQDFAVAASYGTDASGVPSPGPTPGGKKVAVVGDHRAQLQHKLSAHGFAVTSFDRGELKRLTAGIADFSAVVILRLDDPAQVVELTRAADENGVGQVFLGSYPAAYSGLGALVEHTDDPQDVHADYGQGEVEFSVEFDHPVVEGFDRSQPMTIVSGMDNDYQTFAGYSGTVVGRSAMTTGLKGMVGVKDPAAAPRQVLLGALGPNEFTDTSAWTPNGLRLFLNSVDWAAGE